jgi:hypothetical protein
VTSPIFDTLSAEREATPVFESLTRGLDDPMWSFETMAPPSTRGSRADGDPTRDDPTRGTPTREAAVRRQTSSRSAVTDVATWPLRTITC